MPDSDRLWPDDDKDFYPADHRHSPEEFRGLEYQERDYLIAVINSGALQGHPQGRLAEIPPFREELKLHLAIMYAGRRRLRRNLHRRHNPALPVDDDLFQLAESLLRPKPEDYQGTIRIDPDKRFGKPIIRDNRLTPQDVMEYLAGGNPYWEVRKEWDFLQDHDLKAIASFASVEEMDDDYDYRRYAVL